MADISDMMFLYNYELDPISKYMSSLEKYLFSGSHCLKIVLQISSSDSKGISEKYGY